MNKRQTIIVAIIVTAIVAVGATLLVQMFMPKQEQPPVPQPLNKMKIIEPLQRKSYLMVAEQTYTEAFSLSNDVRQKMLDKVVENNTLLEKIIPDNVQSKLQAAKAYFAGDTIEMIASGRVVTVVDLSTLSTEDVVYDEETITITTSPVRVYDVIVDQKVSIPIARDKGIWLKLMDDDELRNLAQVEIRPVIMKTACGTSIMEDSQAAAKETIVNLVKAIVPGKTVVVNVDTAPCALPK